jgi:hypothetical protein
MRNILFMLVLLNFLAFLYQTWVIEPDEKVAANYLQQDFPGLMSVDVTWTPESPPAMAETPRAKAPSLRCLQIGPFAREADADSVRAALETREAEVRQSSEVGQVWVGHWVQVTSLSSREEAERIRDELQSAGIRDAYVLPGDDYRISLGVFRLRSSANGVMQQAGGLGFQTRIDDRFQPGTNFWLRVRMSGDMSRQLGELRTASGQILRTEALSCPDAGF